MCLHGNMPLTQFATPIRYHTSNNQNISRIFPWTRLFQQCPRLVSPGHVLSGVLFSNATAHVFLHNLVSFGLLSCSHAQHTAMPSCSSIIT